MRKARRLLLGPGEGAQCFHVVSRFVGREIVFGDEEREFFRKLLHTQLALSGVRCLAWCCMGNHFHLLLEVPDKEKALEGWTEEDFLARLELLAGEPHVRKVLDQVELWKEIGYAEGVTRVAESVRERLFDLSRFMQEFKQKFSVWFNRRHERCGTLWEERFKSVLVEGAGGGSVDGPGALQAVAAYIDLNAVRAGIVEDPKDYRWCGYAEAVAGDREAREGIARCVGEEGSGWGAVGRRYRMILYATGEERMGGEAAAGSGAAVKRRGFTREEVEAVWAAGGKLTLGEVLRCRVRYFTDGAVLGSRGFVEEVFVRRRGTGLFGEKRKSGARRMRGAEWGELRILRDLQKEAITV